MRNVVIQASCAINIAPHAEYCSHCTDVHTLVSCLMYAWALLEYVIFIMWVRSVVKVLPSVKFAKDKVLTFLILREKC